MTIQEIPKGSIYSIVPPNIQAMICGVYKAGFYPDGRIVLVYTDDSREEAKFPIEEAQALMDKGEESIFPIVSAVQSKRTLI